MQNRHTPWRHALRGYRWTTEHGEGHIDADVSDLDLTLASSRIKLQIGNGGIRGDRPPRTSASRKDPVTNSLPPERAHEASEAPTEVPDPTRPLLRRHRRRQATADAHSPLPSNAADTLPLADATSSSAEALMPEADPAPAADLAIEADLALDADAAPVAPSLRSSRARRRTAAAHTATAAADSTQDETALHSQTTQTQAPSQTKPTPATAPRATQPQTAAPQTTAPQTTQSQATQPQTTDPQPQPQPQAAQGPRSWDPRLRPRHMAPRAASTPQTRVRREKRTWAKSKALGATLAIGVLITGAALPALNPTSGPAAAASAPVSTLADGMSQSYTSKNEIRAEIAPRGNFSATTPEEIKETRSRAAAAAIAAGMPLGSALDIPLAGRIVMPMADGTYSFTDGFGASRPGRSHLGQDFAAPVGTPINAAMKGCVSRSTESYQGYGVTIQIESIVDGQAVSTVYSHMTYGSRAVEVGDCVDEGQYIGDVGSTGYVFGSCLHFEVHINTVAVDPLPWLKKNVS